MNLAISFPLRKIQIRSRAVVAGKTVKGHHRGLLQSTVAITAGADTAVENKIYAPGRAGALEGAPMAAGTFLYSLHRAPPFQGFDQGK